MVVVVVAIDFVVVVDVVVVFIAVLFGSVPPSMGCCGGCVALSLPPGGMFACPLVVVVVSVVALNGGGFAVRSAVVGTNGLTGLTGSSCQGNNSSLIFYTQITKFQSDCDEV